MLVYNFIIDEKEDCQKRIDVFLSEQAEITRSYVKNLIDEGNVIVNEKPITKAGYSTKIGDKITLTIQDSKELNLEPENIPLDIVYEDDDIAVINKPQGMVVHPAPGANEGTLVNALLYNLKSLSSINGIVRPGIVHRIDKNTSGLLVVAKNDFSHLELQKEIQTKEAKRYYVALVDGNVKQDEGVIETLIDRSQKDRKKMAVSLNSGRNAITLFKVKKRYGQYTLMEYELKTGRTHQIRVHSKYIGHPIVGDDVYNGSNKFSLNGQLLHAYKLVLRHPRTNEIMQFNAPYPEYFTKVLNKLDNLSN